MSLDTNMQSEEERKELMSILDSGNLEEAKKHADSLREKNQRRIKIIILGFCSSIWYKDRGYAEEVLRTFGYRFNRR